MGMMTQIVFGILCGVIKHFELHVLFRCLVAVSCALMFTSGQMIRKYIKIYIKIMIFLCDLE